METNPRVDSGTPVLRGTRMPANAIVDNFDFGLSVAEIMEQFDASEENIMAVLEYAKTHRTADRS